MPIVVVDNWSSAVPSTRSKLVEKVARLYGMNTSNSNFNQAALDALDETVNDMNTYTFEFNRVAESGIPLTSGVQSYLLNTQFFKESQAYLTPNTGGDDYPLTYLPWVHFKRLYPTDTTLGMPLVYSIFNFEQDGRAYFYPVPDDSTASKYTLSIEYYRRIPLISSVGESTSIEVPREVENALVYGAQKRLSIIVNGAGNPDVAMLNNLEMQALERLKRIDHLHPDERNRFRVVDFVQRNRIQERSGFYIKVT